MVKPEDVEVLSVVLWRGEVTVATVSYRYRIRGAYARGAVFRNVPDEVGAIAELYKYLEVNNEHST